MPKKTKEALKKSYLGLSPFSEKYKNDFKRFEISLKTLDSRSLVYRKKILDVGSGIGIMALALKNLGGEAIGVDKFIFPEEENNDFTISSFKQLKEKWDENGLKIVNQDILAEKLLFEDDSFDVVICDATIEHLIFSPKNLFYEINRVLKPKGVFFISTPNAATLLKRIRFVFGISPNWDIKDFYEQGNNFKGHTREFTAKEVEKMMSWAGFSILEKKTKNVFFNPKRFFNPKKIIKQISIILSWFFPKSREMVYVLGIKNN